MDPLSRESKRYVEHSPAGVSADVAGDQLQYQQYIGWSAERLLSRIYVKTQDLQTVVASDPDNQRIRKGVRLINVLKLMLLLTKHINA